MLLLPHARVGEGSKAAPSGRGSSNPRPHQKMMLLDLSKLFVQLLLPRQNKDLKPAQQALRQPQAPHHAGLFAMGS